MSIDVTRMAEAFEGEEPRDNVRITTLLRYVAPDGQEWTNWCDFFRFVEIGHSWSERVTWKHGYFLVELLDENQMAHARWNIAVPVEEMSA